MTNKANETFHRVLWGRRSFFVVKKSNVVTEVFDRHGRFGTGLGPRGGLKGMAQLGFARKPDEVVTSEGAFHRAIHAYVKQAANKRNATPILVVDANHMDVMDTPENALVALLYAIGTAVTHTGIDLVSLLNNFRNGQTDEGAHDYAIRVVGDLTGECGCGHCNPDDSARWN